MQVVGHEAGKAAEEVGAALRLAAEDLLHGYERVRKILKVGNDPTPVGGNREDQCAGAVS